MHRPFFSIPCFAILLFVSHTLFASDTTAPWEPLKIIVIKADLAPNKKEKGPLVKQALKLAGECVAQYPHEAGCYYYRGQAIGLHTESLLFGWQKEVRLMIADWQKALSLDPKFDHGGPDRMLGELFTSLPKYFGTKEVRQDIPKAASHLKTSIQIAPDYPTQQLDMAELLVDQKKWEEANLYLKKAELLFPQCQNDPYYPGWQATFKTLNKQILKGDSHGKR
ncbi:MAG: hypothetical protein Q7T03_10115 [Deltaproteobacteria bacterium]|nr:hypothetical protein [Deltaproteobacteria bacterium]